jgi:hypothetical protein
VEATLAHIEALALELLAPRHGDVTGHTAKVVP